MAPTTSLEGKTVPSSSLPPVERVPPDWAGGWERPLGVGGASALWPPPEARLRLVSEGQGHWVPAGCNPQQGRV